MQPSDLRAVFESSPNKFVIVKYLLLLPTLLAFLSLTAQSNRTIEVDDFDKLSVGYGIDVVLLQGNDSKVELSGSDKLVEGLIAEVERGELKLRYDRDWWKNMTSKRGSITATVTTPTLTALSAGGGSDVVSEATWTAESFSLSSSGGSDIELIVKADKVSVRTSGGSDVDLRGSCDQLNLSASGGSDIDASQFVAQIAQVNASGGSDVEVHADGQLDVQASGAADVEYTGNAKVRSNASGSSDIDRG